MPVGSGCWILVGMQGRGRDLLVVLALALGLVLVVGKEGAYTLDEMRDKIAKGDWNENASDGRSSVLEGKEGEAFGVTSTPPAAAHGGRGYEGVKVTIDREIDYNGRQ
jgi:hypothetical protein